MFFNKRPTMMCLAKKKTKKKQQQQKTHTQKQQQQENNNSKKNKWNSVTGPNEDDKLSNLTESTVRIKRILKTENIVSLDIALSVVKGNIHKSQTSNN